MKIDFAKFQGSLPYSSELFGVYQPLLGWKSRRIKRRYKQVADTFRRELIAYITAKVFPDVRVEVRDQRMLSFERFNFGTLSPAQRSGISAQVDSLVARSVLSRIQKLGADPLDDSVWTGYSARRHLLRRCKRYRKPSWRTLHS
jgi:hypothetical protein